MNQYNDLFHVEAAEVQLEVDQWYGAHTVGAINVIGAPCSYPEFRTIARNFFAQVPMMDEQVRQTAWEVFHSAYFRLKASEADVRDAAALLRAGVHLVIFEETLCEFEMESPACVIPTCTRFHS